MRFKTPGVKYIGIIICITMPVWLSILSFNGCNYPVSEVPENRAVEYPDEIRVDAQLLSDYLAESDSICRSLEAFTWQGLDNLGYWQIQESGNCCQDPVLCDKNEQTDMYSQNTKWVSILTWLPDRERIRPVRMLIDSSKTSLNDINSDSINMAGSEDSPDKDKQESWKNLLQNLDSSLKSAIYVTGLINTTSHFNEVTELLKASSDTTQIQYQDKFIEQSGKYSGLLNALIDNLRKASEATGNIIAITTKSSSY